MAVKPRPAGPRSREALDDRYAVTPSPAWERSAPLTVRACEAAFDHVDSFTVGVEEEMMLVAPATYDLAPAIERVLPRFGGDPRFARELRASQIETVTPVCSTAAEACGELAAARAALTAALAGEYRLMACGTHPLATHWDDITAADRYRRIADEYTWAASRSMACGLHIHVAVGGAARALAIYNALRSFLPELAALTANSTFFGGVDTGMCSVRPKLNEAYPRAGVPPAFETWEELVRFVEWGRRGSLFPDASHFWWDLRLHAVHGTIEVRVADCQTRVGEASAVVALVQALVAWLAERLDGGERLPVHQTFWITENAWRAHRYGVRGWLVDLDSGRAEPTRDRLARLLDDLEPYAARFGALEQLRGARPLLAGNGADRQRYVHARDGMTGLMRWLVDETEGSATDG